MEGDALAKWLEYRLLMGLVEVDSRRAIEAKDEPWLRANLAQVAMGERALAIRATGLAEQTILAAPAAEVRLIVEMQDQLNDSERLLGQMHVWALGEQVLLGLLPDLEAKIAQ
jgi:hypothetical protein